MRFSALRRSLLCLSRIRARLGLSVSEVMVLCAGFALLGATIVVFGGVTEDVTQHNGLSGSDVLHLRWFTTHRSGSLISVAHLVTDIGNIAVLGIVAVVAGAVLWRRGLRLVVALAPAIALGIGGVSAAGAKSLVARSRPPVALHLVSEAGASFPSGHTTDSTALYVTLALVVAIFVLRRPLLRLVCALGSGGLAGAIGLSRLFLGVHWPTDVVAGWALGASIALAVTIAAGVAARVAPQVPRSPNHRLLARVVYVMTRERRPRSLQVSEMTTGSVTEVRCAPVAQVVS
jgi:membrane-associated phospholipid phosphatase